MSVVLHGTKLPLIPVKCPCDVATNPQQQLWQRQQVTLSCSARSSHVIYAFIASDNSFQTTAFTFRLSQKLFAQLSRRFLHLACDTRKTASMYTLHTQLQGRNIFAQAVADERCPFSIKCERNYRNFVKLVKPRSVSVIYCHHRELRRENEVDVVNVYRQHLCYYLLFNVNNCTRCYGSFSSTTAFLYDPWQSTEADKHSQCNVK